MHRYRKRHDAPNLARTSQKNDGPRQYRMQFRQHYSQLPNFINVYLCLSTYELLAG